MLGIESKISTIFYPQINKQTKRVNQKLEQYLRMFINHRQEQWLDWLGTVEFAYNNKVHLSMKMSPFKANYRQDPRIKFEVRKKGKYEGAGKFIMKMKEIQEEAKTVLEKAQERIKKYTDRKREEVDKYKVEDLVMLSTKDLKYQMIGKRTEKLIERFVGPYKVKKIISANIVELELPSTILKRDRKLGEYKESGWRIWKGIPTGYKRYKITKRGRRDIQKRRTARTIYSKETIWMVRQEV